MIPRHCAYFCCCTCFGIKNINITTRFDQIHQLFHKILSIYIILKSINGHNSVEKSGKIMCISYNMDHIYQCINKILSKFIHLFWLLRKNTFLHHSRAVTLLFMNKFSPFAIPNHSSLISKSVQSLKKSIKNYLRVRKWHFYINQGP